MFGGCRQWWKSRTSDNHPVILKTTAATHPTPGQVACYRHEYRILKSIKPEQGPHVVRVLDLVERDHRPYLVMEDTGGADFRNLIQSGPVDLAQALDIQVAVDQTSGERREFKLKAYIEDVLLSLKPKLKKTEHVVTVNCPEDLTLNRFPGALSQIISNLVINSLFHGFEGIEQGQITFDAAEENGSVIITYRDDGKGMDEKTLSKIFDPFFTTKRSQGGSGLGMHIANNLVTQTLGGKISCESQPGNGMMIKMEVPMSEA